MRIDTHVYEAYAIPPYYDSMIGKLIVTAATRELAIKRAVRALDEFVVEGVKTTIPFHQAVLNNGAYLSGDFTTNLINEL